MFSSQIDGKFLFSFSSCQWQRLRILFRIADVEFRASFFTGEFTFRLLPACLLPSGFFQGKFFCLEGIICVYLEGIICVCNFGYLRKKRSLFASVFLQLLLNGFGVGCLLMRWQWPKNCESGFFADCIKLHHLEWFSFNKEMVLVHAIVT